MATRLEIQHGLISERDRLSTSADTVSVTRPSTGSKTRSKGVLFVVVGSAIPGPRAREATKLVAETIRHEYYYDESAGVPVCLEKAVKAADRRLRSSREGAGLQRTMDRACSTAFTLHLDYLRDRIPKVLHAGSRPFICPLTHR